MKVYTLGNGFVSAHFPYENLTKNFRVENDSKFLDKMIEEHKPDVLINCIGKTGSPNVDWCESNKEITASTNVALPILLAEACKKKDVQLVHIGSGCIFFGPSPHLDLSGKDMGWREDDFANPKSFYSKTKYAADLALSNFSNVAILRIRMPLSPKNLPRNLINKLTKYTEVIDIPNSVTFIDDLVKCVDWTIKNTKTGVYHVTNPEPLSAARVMKEYQKYDANHKFNIISESRLDELTIAKRSNCILSTQKLNAEGFYLPSSEEALFNCMQQYIRS